MKNKELYNRLLLQHFPRLSFKQAFVQTFFSMSLEHLLTIHCATLESDYGRLKMEHRYLIQRNKVLEKERNEFALAKVIYVQHADGYEDFARQQFEAKHKTDSHKIGDVSE